MGEPEDNNNNDGDEEAGLGLGLTAVPVAPRSLSLSLSLSSSLSSFVGSCFLPEGVAAAIAIAIAADGVVVVPNGCRCCSRLGVVIAVADDDDGADDGDDGDGRRAGTLKGGWQAGRETGLERWWLPPSTGEGGTGGTADDDVDEDDDEEEDDDDNGTKRVNEGGGIAPWGVVTGGVTGVTVVGL